MPGDRQTGKAADTRRARTGRTTGTDRPAADRALDREREMGALDETHDPGRQPGAHGRQSPHREIKPGVRRALEEADPERS